MIAMVNYVNTRNNLNWVPVIIGLIRSVQRLVRWLRNSKTRAAIRIRIAGRYVAVSKEAHIAVVYGRVQSGEDDTIKQLSLTESRMWRTAHAYPCRFR